MFEGQHDLGSIKLGSVLSETFGFVGMQVVEKLSPIDELHNHVQVRQVLKGILQTHDKWMVKASQDVSLGWYNTKQ